LAIAAALAAAAGCGSKPIAKVNGQVISEQDFCEALQTGPTNAVAARGTLDQTITRRLVADAVKKAKITVSEAELGQARAQFQQMPAFQQGWMPLIQSQLATDQDVDRDIEFTIDVMKLFVKHDDLMKFFEKNRKYFDRPAEVTFRRIGFTTQAEAAKAAQQIASKKETFEQVARERAADPKTAAETGEAGPFREGFSGGHNTELENLLFKGLKLNEVSQPVKVSVATDQVTPNQDRVRESWWELLQVVRRTPRIAATWDNSWYAVMQQAVADPEFMPKIAAGLDKLRAEGKVEVLVPKYSSVSQRYEQLRQQQPPSFGGPSKAAPPAAGKAAPAPGTKAPAAAPAPSGR
jgi:hypothetical protein